MYTIYYETTPTTNQILHAINLVCVWSPQSFYRRDLNEKNSALLTEIVLMTLVQVIYTVLKFFNKITNLGICANVSTTGWVFLPWFTHYKL